MLFHVMWPCSPRLVRYVGEAEWVVGPNYSPVGRLKVAARREAAASQDQAKKEKGGSRRRTTSKIGCRPLMLRETPRLTWDGTLGIEKHHLLDDIMLFANLRDSVCFHSSISTATHRCFLVEAFCFRAAYCFHLFVTGLVHC